ncbi:lysozyme-like [Watersipora subatra]|uniref:lysozyme-like n=1 Tax=Watersipora subatra TaxID=2589382 RepID=UPI00355C208E
MSLMVLKLVLVLLTLAGNSARISRSCMNCIGKVEGGGRFCNGDMASPSCGLYQIKKKYWKDCDTGFSWRLTSAINFQARRCISSYMKRYEGRCAKALGKKTSSLTCDDYGRLHNGGPNGCSARSTLTYLKAMRKKC